MIAKILPLRVGDDDGEDYWDDDGGEEEEGEGEGDGEETFGENEGA